MNEYEAQKNRAMLNLGAGIAAVRPSLEQRLDHLQRGAEIASELRRRLGDIADRLSTAQAGDCEKTPSPPPPQDLSGRFGETINYLHSNLDEIRGLVNRIEGGLFESRPAVGQAQRA